MATRSVNSSLLGPPTTIDEDADSIVGDLPYQDENRPNVNLKAVGRRSNDAVIEELDSFALSPPVARTIKDFNDELDSLKKSFDGLLSRKKDRLRPRESSVSSIATPHLSYISTTHNYNRVSTPLREKDPPPSVGRASPLRSYVHSTPARRAGSASYTPSEPPPAPVETPGFGSPTPNRARARRTTAQRQEETSFTANRTTETSTRREPSPATRSEKKDPTMENLLRIIKDQASRIQDLEIENEVLRRKLQLQPPTVERVHRSSSLVMDDLDTESNKDEEPPPAAEEEDGRKFQSPPRTVRRSHDPEPKGMFRPGSVDRSPALREEPEGRHRPTVSSPSPYQTAQTSFFSTPSRPEPLVERTTRTATAAGPPRHIHTLTEAIEEYKDGFTPGTRFVAQLATLMKLEQAHCVPLSVIIDKHWDKLKHHMDPDEQGRYQY